jgi:hypothetical protein
MPGKMVSGIAIDKIDKRRTIVARAGQKLALRPVQVGVAERRYLLHSVLPGLSAQRPQSRT